MQQRIMSREKKALYTTVSSLIFEVVSIVCGFILPHCILANYGSEVNGIISSITTFLGFFTLADCGIGAVIRSSFYKPLSAGDRQQISKVYLVSERFYRRLALVLAAYILCLVLVYPNTVKSDFDFAFSAGLIAVLSINAFAQYYFGMTNSILIGADQREYIVLVTQICTIIINTLVSILLIKLGFSIHIVKLSTAIIFLAKPVVFVCYVKKHYSIDRNVSFEKNEDPIKQKWNGLAQHIATVVLSNTDIALLTIFSDMKNVSVYSVHFLVINGVKSIITSFTKGFQSLFGNMLANRETEKMLKVFDFVEWLIHTLTTLAFSLTAILIVPFVQLYTKNVLDTNYTVPLFAYLLTAAYGAYCLRLPYNIMVLAAGHFKETQMSAIIEALLNIVISIIAVTRFGLVGVSIGTLLAMIYRTSYLSCYINRNILSRTNTPFVKHFVVDIITSVLIIIITSFFVIPVDTYWGWFCEAIKLGIIALIITVAINYAFYKIFLLRAWKMISTGLKSKHINRN